MAGETHAKTEHHIMMNRLVCTEAKQQIAIKTTGKNFAVASKTNKRVFRKRGGCKNFHRGTVFLSERYLESKFSEWKVPNQPPPPPLHPLWYQVQKLS